MGKVFPGNKHPTRCLNMHSFANGCVHKPALWSVTLRLKPLSTHALQTGTYLNITVGDRMREHKCPNQSNRTLNRLCAPSSLENLHNVQLSPCVNSTGHCHSEQVGVLQCFYHATGAKPEHKQAKVKKKGHLHKDENGERRQSADEKLIIQIHQKALVVYGRFQNPVGDFEALCVSCPVAHLKPKHIFALGQFSFSVCGTCQVAISRQFI